MAGGPLFDRFLRTHTRVVSPPLCPEILLHLGSGIEATWAGLESCLDPRGVGTPYWSVAWVGGQALARYVLDRPQLFRGRSVLDFGSGSGLCAIAAAKAGAQVQASDIDPYAIDAIVRNAALNNVHVEPVHADVIGTPSRWDIVVAGDLWYEGYLARRLTTWLRGIARGSVQVFLGDCGRAHFPRSGAAELQRYMVPSPESLERSSNTATSVWRLGPSLSSVHEIVNSPVRHSPASDAYLTVKPSIARAQNRLESKRQIPYVSYGGRID